VKKAAVFTVAFLMLGMCMYYSVLVFRNEVQPKLATWIILDSGVIISFISYRLTKKHSLVDNIANTTDVVFGSGILVAILFCGGWNGLRFSSFDVWCLAAMAAILTFWIIKRNHSATNLAIQALMVLGYFPTLKNLWIAKTNPESFVTWGVMWFVCIISLYPAYKGKNRLAVVYAARGIIMVFILILLMLRVEFRS
jgi:hypothetical protein